MGSLSLGLRVISRQLRAQPAVFISILMATLVAALLLGGAPRLLEEVSKDDLRATVTEPPPSQRDIRAERFGRLGAGPSDDPMLAVQRVGESFAEREIPPTVSEVISDQFYLVDSPRFTVTPVPGEDPPHPFPMTIKYRYQEAIEDHVTLVSGSLPEPREPVTMLLGPQCPEDPDEREMFGELLESGGDETTEEVDCQFEEVPIYEIAVTQSTAEAMGVETGRLMLLTPDSRDRLFFGLSGESLRYQMGMVISGIIELTDPSLEYWYGDVALHRPAIQENADLRIIFATGLMSPQVYGDMLESTGEASRNYVWRYLVEPDLVVSADVQDLLAELIPFQVHFSPAVARPTDLSVVTQLPRLLSEHLEQRSQTVALLSIAVSGLLGVVIGVISLLAVMMTDHQRTHLVLIRNRGASAGQLTLTRFYESVIMVVPAAVLGYLATETLIPDTEGLTSYRFVVGLAGAAVAAIVAAVVPLLTTSLGLLQREPIVGLRSSPRRLVFELLSVVLAIGSVTLLRRRGASDTPVEAGTIDYLLALAPLMIGVAAGIVTLRIYPLVVSAISWVAGRSKGVVGFVGFRRLLGGTLASRLPVAVILICVAVAAFAASISTSLTHGQQLSSFQVVGSDFAVKGFGPDVGLPTSISFEDVAPEGPAVFGRSFSGARLEGETSGAPTQVLAVDLIAYAEMTTSTLGDVGMPAKMLEPPTAAGLGTDASPVPVVVSEAWPTEFLPRIGQVFTLDLGRLRPRVEVVDVRPRYPDIALDASFVVIDLPSLEAISELPLTPTVAYLSGPPTAEGSLTEAVSESAPSARVISRYAFLRGVAEDPFVAWAYGGLRVVFVFATVFAIVAAVSALALGSAVRRRDFGFLKTTGLNTSEATGMTVIEQLPTVFLGTVLGVLVGAGTAMLLEPSIDLDGFTGDVVPTELFVRVSDLVVLSVSLLVALTIAVATFVLVNRRQDLGRTLRVGQE